MQNKFLKRKFSKENTKRIPVESIFKDRKFQIMVGIVLQAIALYLFISIVSYLFTSKFDQILVESVNKETFNEISKKISNKLGFLGALFSYYLYFRWFGITSFLVTVSIYSFGHKLVLNKNLNLFKANTILWFLVFWINITLSYIDSFLDKPNNFEFLFGGIGLTLFTDLKKFIGQGVLLIIIVSMLIFLVYIFNIRNITNFNLLNTIKKLFRFSANSLFKFLSFFRKGTMNKNHNYQNSVNEDINDDNNNNNSNHSFEFDLNKNTKTKEEKNSNISFIVEENKTTFDKINSKFENNLSSSVATIEKKEPLTNGKLDTDYDPCLDLSKYKFPSSNLLKRHNFGEKKVTPHELEQNKDKILETLTNFNIGISSIKATIGPTVTLYEIIPEPGVKISKIKNLEDDIALNLAALGIRIIAPIPGKGTIGIEVPNKQREVVPFKSIIESEKFLNAKMDLPIILGKTISNEIYIYDLASMPHLLIAGATGQGKSVGLNVILSSLLYKKHPSQLKFVLVDPKKVELSLFSKIERHFLAKIPSSEEAIITETKEVVHTLNSLCIEMDTRYELLKDAGVRNIKEYNTKFIKRSLNPLQGHRFLPYIVLVIDEFADMIMTAGKEIETPIARLAQLARAIGIHLVLATQRPSVNVITGTIKANFPARISYKVSSKIDSRTILDAGGADQLVGKGDFLLSINSNISRLQCPFLNTEEIDNICDFIGSQKGYLSAYELPIYESETEKKDIGNLDERDSMFEEAAKLIVSHQQGSTSLIQRRLKLGYNRAGRLIDQLEAAGIVGPFEGSKARAVLIPDEYSLKLLLKNLNEKKNKES